MTPGRKMLLQTLAGHLALLESANPRKASSPLAKRTQRYVKACLRRHEGGSRRQAA
jgi:hypothetical protein